MIRWGLVIGVSALCLSGAPASAGPLEIYQLLGVSPGQRGRGRRGVGMSRHRRGAGRSRWAAPGRRTRNPRVGFYGGLGLRYRHNDLLSFATEGELPPSRGARWELDELGSGLTLTQTLALNYVEIPLLVQVTPAAGGDRAAPRSYAGPYLGLLAPLGDQHRRPARPLAERGGLPGSRRRGQRQLRRWHHRGGGVPDDPDDRPAGAHPLPARLSATSSRTRSDTSSSRRASPYSSASP